MDNPQAIEAILLLAAWCKTKGIAFIHLVEADWDDAPQVPCDFRETLSASFRGAIIMAGNYTREKAEKLLTAGIVDQVTFGRPFIANPDFPHRMKDNPPLTKIGNPATLFGGTEVGYTDYPSFTAAV